MAIDTNNINSGARAAPARAGEQRSASPDRVASDRSANEGARRQTNTDSVELRLDRNNLERLTASAREAESFDRQRVDKIASAIREGRYPLDSSRIAEKFLEFERQINQ